MYLNYLTCQILGTLVPVLYEADGAKYVTNPVSYTHLTLPTILRV